MSKKIVIVSVMFLSSCSNTISTIVENESVDGLTYFMPNKDFIVTITMSEPDEKTGINKVNNVVFSTSTAYADRSIQYVLQHGTNLLNDNKLDITVDTRGLLKSSKSTSNSKVADVLKG